MEPKIYLENYNGVLDSVEDHYDKLGLLTNNQLEASVIVLWQDVRGAQAYLTKIAKESLDKPVIVMQHGRGATRDYDAPNNLKFQADKIMVWGESERLRLLRLGIPDNKIVVTGCPLLPALKPRKRAPDVGKNILFVPVIAEMEAPENLLVYAELKKWESSKLQDFLRAEYDNLKKGWATQHEEYRDVQLPDGTIDRRLFSRQVKPMIPRNVTYKNGLITVKLTGVHDAPQYMAPVAMTNQGDANHFSHVAELLANTDVMVCLEEGTMQLLACALDIPVIVVDIFKYGTYGGVKNYDSVEKIKTDACYQLTDLKNLQNTVDYALSHPEHRRGRRIQAVEHEGGAHLGDITQNVINAIESYRIIPKLASV